MAFIRFMVLSLGVRSASLVRLPFYQTSLAIEVHHPARDGGKLVKVVDHFAQVVVQPFDVVVPDGNRIHRVDEGLWGEWDAASLTSTVFVAILTMPADVVTLGACSIVAGRPSSNLFLASGDSNWILSQLPGAAYLVLPHELLEARHELADGLEGDFVLGQEGVALLGIPTCQMGRGGRLLFRGNRPVGVCLLQVLHGEDIGVEVGHVGELGPLFGGGIQLHFRELEIGSDSPMLRFLPRLEFDLECL